MLSGVGLADVPTAVECFTREVAVMVVQYFHTTLFQHYVLFQYLFSEEQEEETVKTDVRLYLSLL